MELAILAAILIGWIVTIGGLILVHLNFKKEEAKHSH
jgi:hypothetical protein